MDIFADNMLGSIKSTAHKRVVLNNMIEGKSCTKAISHLLDKFFPEEKKEGNEKK
jgi:hypothetical protein